MLTFRPILLFPRLLCRLIHGLSKKVIVQAVHELFDKISTEEWKNNEERMNRLIFIVGYDNKL